jgi:hypothetical protein
MVDDCTRELRQGAGGHQNLRELGSEPAVHDQCFQLPSGLCASLAQAIPSPVDDDVAGTCK